MTSELPSPSQRALDITSPGSTGAPGKAKKRYVLSSKFIQSLNDTKVSLLQALDKTLDLRINKQDLELFLFKQSYDDADTGIKDYVLNFTTFSPATNEYLFDPKKLRRVGIYLTERKITHVDIDFDKVTKLLIAYNQARDLLYKRRNNTLVTPVTQKLSMHKHYNNMINMFEANHIEDWYLYFYTLFASLDWRFCWSIKGSYSDRAFDMYSNNVSRFRDIAYGSKDIVRQQSKYLDIYQHIEDLKRVLINKKQERVCYMRLEDLLGYHPKSVVCQCCPASETCAIKIRDMFKTVTGTDLDIVELRAGHIDMKMAEKVLGDFDLYA